MNTSLSNFQESQILSLFPKDASIVGASYFRDEYLPCPIKVTVKLPDHSQTIVVLRVVRHREASLIREATLLPILRDAGLPVPEVLIAPTTDPEQADGRVFAVYTFLSGENCQKLAEQSVSGTQLAIQLVTTAARTLAEVTLAVRSAVKDDLVPEITLLDELTAFCVEANPWFHDPRLTPVVDLLHTRLHKDRSPLVFTNGDYQPANFLTDGQNETGYVDFEYASYQDFLYGFTKYPIYDLHPLNKAGMISYLLEMTGIPPTHFALRLALGCLRTLQREISAEDSQSPYCQHIFRLLDTSMEQIQ